MLTFIVDDIGTLYATFSDETGKKDPDTTPQVAVYYKGVVKHGPVDMVKISTGYYYYSFTIPDTYVPGNYSAIYTGTLNSTPFQNEESFEIIESFTPVYPAVPAGYCSVADVKMYLGGADTSLITDCDSIIGTLIPVAQREIDIFCHQNFKSTAVTWNFNGAGTNRMVSPWRPLVSVSSVVLRVIPSISWYTFAHIRYINVNELGVNIATLSPDDTDADLFVDMGAGIFVIPPRILYMEAMAMPFWNYTFLDVGRTYNVRMTLTYGYSTLPVDIQHACAKKVAIQMLGFLGDKVSGGATSRSVDGYSASFQGMPFSARIVQYEKEIETTLKRYRRLSV